MGKWRSVLRPATCVNVALGKGRERGSGCGGVRARSERGGVTVAKVIKAAHSSAEMKY